MPLAWRMLAILTIARMAMGFQFQSIAPVAPLLSADLGFDQAAIGWLIGMYLLPGVAFALPGGVLGARFGDKRMVLIGLAAMAAGALLMTSGQAGLLTTGRLLSGIGGAIYNVLAAKMVADWFTGKTLVLAMSILINAWPIGITLALLVLGALAEAASWPAAFGLTAGLAAAALLLVAIGYRRAPGAAGAAAIRLRALGGRTWRLLVACALPWMLYNAGLVVMIGFLPTLLVARGLSVATAGATASMSSLAIVFSVQAGGLLVHRFDRAALITVVGIAGWLVFGVALLYGESVLLWVVLAGLLGGLPAGILVSIPGQFLSPAERGAGMGVFYTIYYVGNATLPGFGGHAADRFGDPAAALWFAYLLLVLTLVSYGAYLWLHGREKRAAGRGAPAARA